MRVCPKCGYLEPEEWKPTTWKSAQFIDCIRVCELQRIDAKLFHAIETVSPADYVAEEHYAYKISRTRIWILRRWKPIYLVQGWKDIPAEKAKKPTVLPNQTRLLEVEKHE